MLFFFFCFFFFFGGGGVNVQEHPKAQPAVVLILKRLRRLDKGLK